METYKLGMEHIKMRNAPRQEMNMANTKQSKIKANILKQMKIKEMKIEAIPVFT